MSEDSCEDVGDGASSDSNDDAGAVDTDVEVSSKNSGDSSDTSDLISTDTSDDEEPAQKKPASGGLPTTGSTGSKKYAGHSGKIVFDNDYFYLKRNKLDHRIDIHDTWLVDPPQGLGRSPAMSKTITPSRAGETQENPVRTKLCLRAWMIWRARAIPGWVEGSACQERLFLDEAKRLLSDIKKLQPQADGLLGNSWASSLLNQWVPDLVAVLKK